VEANKGVAEKKIKNKRKEKVPFELGQQVLFRMNSNHVPDQPQACPQFPLCHNKNPTNRHSKPENQRN
jgi:hypothetical protein